MVRLAGHTIAQVAGYGQRDKWVGKRCRTYENDSEFCHRTLLTSSSCPNPRPSIPAALQVLQMFLSIPNLIIQLCH